jgi:transcription initiation factor TFIIF subunit beta
MRLEDIPQHKNLPKEYNMEIANPDVHNTFVFSEQDLPSYAAKNKERAAALKGGMPAHLLRQQQQPRQADTKQPADRTSRRAAPYTRKAIPSKAVRSGHLLLRS